MKRKVIVVLLSGMLVGAALTACGSTEEAGSSAATVSEESEEDAEALEEAMQKEAAEKEAKAEECYAAGRAYLYGLDGKEKDLEAAFNSFEEAVDLGKEEANFYMGLLYDWESYPLQDYKQARAYYEAAGENPLAYISLGYNYYYGQGVETDQEKGKEYFDKAVALGCIDGYIGLGTVASDEGDYAAAMEDYKKAAEQGTEPVYIQTALIDVAGLYREGLGVEQDGTQAIEWYEKAVEAGKSSGYNYIGVMYENGNGVEQDYAKAMEWYEKGVECGNTVSMSNIANLYYEGLGVEQDYSKSLEWREKAAEAGHAASMAWIGYMNLYGQGTEADTEKGIEWYAKAYEHGMPEYAYEIAYLYEKGEAVEQDYAKAMEWYEKAYEAGYGSAAAGIGSLYYDGFGVEQDTAKAIEWFEKGYEEYKDAMCAFNLAASIYADVDTAKEIEWFEKGYEAAEEAGDAGMQYMCAALLSSIYEYDEEKAEEWQIKADEALSQ